jgi:hypothetical protein
MSVTGHYIDAPKTSLRDWELHSVQLGLAHVNGCHTSKNLACILVRVVDRYGFQNKVCIECRNYGSISFFVQTGWITADNASNMDTCMKTVGQIINPNAQMQLEPGQRRIQYVIKYTLSYNAYSNV